VSKVKDAISREKAITEIYSIEEEIENTFLKISYSLNDYPDTWIDSVNKNYASFLGFCHGISKKFDEEIKPTIE